jgi:hypothetical protein
LLKPHPRGVLIVPQTANRFQCGRVELDSRMRTQGGCSGGGRKQANGNQAAWVQHRLHSITAEWIEAILKSQRYRRVG